MRITKAMLEQKVRQLEDQLSLSVKLKLKVEDENKLLHQVIDMFFTRASVMTAGATRMIEAFDRVIAKIK